jgi:hypothetical protein
MLLSESVKTYIKSSDFLDNLSVLFPVTGLTSSALNLLTPFNGVLFSLMNFSPMLCLRVLDGEIPEMSSALASWVSSPIIKDLISPSDSA